ncbi:hypothetical protein FHETE_9645 [Fusarium heterosporum]|uniref:Uncharacterized protein n=1 Tax=Fusarium heterosporum TaxID=42747 RepID=A0A8H5SYC3_FUSHE|nr:hypothetical protein FHETE_9645 [Fusarium heterosporum]
MEAIGTIIDITSDLILDGAAEQAADIRQAQILQSLSKIQSSIQNLAIENANLADIIRINTSVNDIEGWQKDYPVAVRADDKKNIDSFLTQFYNKGSDGALGVMNNIFNVLTGEGVGPGTTPLLQMWHLQSYKKMYTPINGQYTFTLKDYLDDYNKVISWALNMTGYALSSIFLAANSFKEETTNFKTLDLAYKSTSAEGINDEVESYKQAFKTNADKVLSVAYEQFPSFIKKFKPNYTDVGNNLGQWFRMWLPGQHVKNYVGGTGDGRDVLNSENYGAFVYDTNAMYQIYPLDCDDDEGIYPAVEFRFDEANHPLNGLATLISRVDGATVSIYNCEASDDQGMPIDMSGPNSAGLTTTTDPQYWCDGVTFTQASFNILPVSAEDMGNNPAPGFVLMVANPPSDLEHGQFDWVPGTASPLSYWILRDDGLDQTNESGDDSRAPSPNPSV